MISFLWDNLLIDPMVNALVGLDRTLFSNFGLAIIAFTVIIRAATFPLTMRQLRSTKALSELQPRIQEIQKKHKDPKRRNEETMKLYREAGVNPLGCIFPMLIQFPIWIALYSVIRLTLAGTPESYVNLSQKLYAISYVQHAVPIDNAFLWMDLGQPDFVLPVLVGVSMWAQQRSTMLRNTSTQTAQQAQMNNTMLWMMPLMFAWFSLTVPAGLALYWFSTNVIGIVLNGFVFGFASLHPRKLLSMPSAAGASVSPAKERKASPPSAPTTAGDEPDTPDDARTSEETSDGRQRRSKRKNRRRGR